MTSFAQPIGAGVREASFLIEPDPGLDIFDVINDARMTGYRSITVHENNTATVVLYTEEGSLS